LQHISPCEGGWTTVYTDSAYVCKGMRLPSRALLLGANGDLWSLLNDQLARHGGRVVSVKVAAHHTLADVRCGAVLIKEYLGNLVADRMAFQFTEPAQVGADVESAQSFRHAVIAKVLRHITTAMICVVEMSSSSRAARRRRGHHDDHAGDQVHVRQAIDRRSRVPKLVSSEWGVVSLSNGHSIQEVSVGTWGCLHCRYRRRSCDPKVWRRECAQFVVPAPIPGQPPSDLAAQVDRPPSRPHELDVPEHDLDNAIDMEQSDNEHAPLPAEGPASAQECSSQGCPSVAVPAGPVSPCVAAEACDPRRRSGRLLVVDGRICIGSTSVHATHSLRFNGAYFWCERCAAFTTGAVARLLKVECRCTTANATSRHVLGRLGRGLTPLSHLSPVDGISGTGRIVLGADRAGPFALQLYDP